MSRAVKKWDSKLYAILGMCGVPKCQKDELLNLIADFMLKQVGNQVIGYAEQTMIDTVAIVMHDEYGFGAQRIQKLLKDIREKADEIDILCEDETRDNVLNRNYEENGKPDFLHLKRDIDDTLRPLYGDEFMEYDERHKKAQENTINHDFNEILSIIEKEASGK